MKKHYLIIYGAVFIFLLSASGVRAHMFWLSVSKDSPEVGEPGEVKIGFGHKFPQGEEIKAERLGAVPALSASVKITNDNWSNPKNSFITTGKTDGRGKIRIKVDKPGKWLIIVSHKTPYTPRDECDDNYYITPPVSPSRCGEPWARP